MPASDCDRIAAEVSRRECAGGEGAPDLTESLLNLSINSAALAGFSYLFLRDLQGAERDKEVVDREELLGRLLVSRLLPSKRLHQSPCGCH